jgi:hypothetical protein
MSRDLGDLVVHCCWYQRKQQGKTCGVGQERKREAPRSAFLLGGPSRTIEQNM